MIIEIAWGWLRFQPDSQLSGWYQQRFGQESLARRSLSQAMNIEQRFSVRDI